MKSFKQALLIFLLLLVILVMVQNAKPVPFQFLAWKYEVSQLLLVLIVLTVGFAVGFVAAKLTGRKPRE